MTTSRRDRDGRRSGERDAHVWRCSLNLVAEDGRLPDERWARIAEEFIEHMGFGGEHR